MQYPAPTQPMGHRHTSQQARPQTQVAQGSGPYNPLRYIQIGSNDMTVHQPAASQVQSADAQQNMDGGEDWVEQVTLLVHIATVVLQRT